MLLRIQDYETRHDAIMNYVFEVFMAIQKQCFTLIVSTYAKCGDNVDMAGAPSLPLILNHGNRSDIDEVLAAIAKQDATEREREKPGYGQKPAQNAQQPMAYDMSAYTQPMQQNTQPMMYSDMQMMMQQNSQQSMQQNNQQMMQQPMMYPDMQMMMQQNSQQSMQQPMQYQGMPMMQSVQQPMQQNAAMMQQPMQYMNMQQPMQYQNMQMQYPMQPSMNTVQQPMQSVPMTTEQGEQQMNEANNTVVVEQAEESTITKEEEKKQETVQTNSVEQSADPFADMSGINTTAEATKK